MNTQQKISADWYRNNRERFQELVKQDRLRRAKALFELKKKLKCVKCGYDKHPAALDFHHKNPKKKEAQIAQMAITGSWAKMLEEIKKCIVLCSNCHRIEHYKLRRKKR